MCASFTPITTNNQIQGFQWENRDVDQPQENTAQVNKLHFAIFFNNV